MDGDRIYLPLRTAHVVAFAVKDGHEIWRVAKTVTTAMAAAEGLLFMATDDAVEAVRGNDGANAWIAPRLKAAAPLITASGLVIVATDTELIALRAATGEIAWRRPAGGILLSPAVDGSRVVAGANDGRIVAVDLADGAVAWEQYVPGGVTALEASRGLVYAGAGDKSFYCLDGRKGKVKWLFRIGSVPSGAIAVDDDRVYFTARDNVIRAHDRENGNQRWQTPLNRRPVGGVRVASHVVFVEASGTELLMLFDQTGERSGIIALPSETTRDIPLDVREKDGRPEVFIVTGSLANDWRLTMIGPGGEAAMEPFAGFAIPGVPFLTDPQLTAIGRSLPWLLLTDPVAEPFSEIGYPVVLRDPPLQPLTILPGIQLRPLSPALPARRGG